MRVAVVITVEEEDVMGATLPRVAARIGERDVTAFAKSFDRLDVEQAIGSVVARAVELHYRGWGLVRELFKPASNPR